MKVEMRTAYEWTCEECGRNHFHSAMVADFTEEDRLETAKRLGLVEEFASEVPEDMQGDFVTYPESVTCPDCGSEFETVHPHDDDEE